MKYITYPSGFVGSAEVDIGIVEKERIDLAMKMGLFKQRLSDAKDEPYCVETELLYQKYFGKHMKMSTLTRLMRLAVRHIGDDPIAWLKRHNDSEYKKFNKINRYNIEFICDTLMNYGGFTGCMYVSTAYIDTSVVNRKLTLEAWRRFINNGSNDDSIGNLSVYKKILADKRYDHFKTIDLLANWVSTNSGQQDLLESMKLMYGKLA